MDAYSQELQDAIAAATAAIQALREKREAVIWIYERHEETAVNGIISSGHDLVDCLDDLQRKQEVVNEILIGRNEELQKLEDQLKTNQERAAEQQAKLVSLENNLLVRRREEVELGAALEILQDRQRHAVEAFTQLQRIRKRQRMIYEDDTRRRRTTNYTKTTATNSRQEWADTSRRESPYAVVGQ